MQLGVAGRASARPPKSDRYAPKRERTSRVPQYPILRPFCHTRSDSHQTQSNTPESTCGCGGPGAWSRLLLIQLAASFFVRKEGDCKLSCVTSYPYLSLL